MYTRKYHLDELDLVAHELIKLINFGTATALEGELGAGKTTLVSALVRALGSRDEVSSPTYVLEHEYQCLSGKIQHWDLYRCSELPEELYEPCNATEVRLIEWASKVSFQDVDFLVDIKVTDNPLDGLRELTVKECRK